LLVVEEKMKSFSRIHSPSDNARLEAWNMADLDVESNVMPADDEIEHIMVLFDAGKEHQPGQPNHASRLTFHPRGLEVALDNWFPDDLDLQVEEEKPAQWEFINPSNDFTDIPEQQNLQEKLEAEKERIDLIKRARTEAEEVLRAAHLEADKIILHARDEIEQAKTNAYQAACKEMQDALAATWEMVEETRKWQTSFMESGEQVLTGMLKEIAQTVFGEGVNLDSNALQINLNRIMESAQRLGDLNIFLNPQDANLLDPSWSDYQLLITGNKVRVVPSEKILPGGCFVKGCTGAVDARVETQLASVLNTIDEMSGTVR
jgi:flagellar biosynthesis/type III secretory pathway protein FliH